jgi:hypothetical protein
MAYHAIAVAELHSVIFGIQHLSAAILMSASAPVPFRAVRWAN